MKCFAEDQAKGTDRERRERQTCRAENKGINIFYEVKEKC